MSKSKWVLHHGIHRGTLTSRDTGNPQSFDTREEAIEELNKLRNWYKSIGYQIWFANLTSPKGGKQILEQNPYY